jgi:RNA polymerase sigma factor (sigma-70 family)
MSGRGAHEADIDAERRRTALMIAAQAGDRAAYELLLRECVSLIKAIAGRQGVPRDRIDDAVQETLLTLHGARHTYDPARPFTAWLRVIAQRRAIDLLRSAGRRELHELHAPHAYENHPDPTVEIHACAERSAVLGRLEPAIAALPSKQREAVKHLVVDERTLTEAAALTGNTKGALKVNLHRALKKLRDRLSTE